MRERNDWRAAFVAITERDDYVESLERDGYWAKEEE